jgi:hypothetical protein
MAITKQVYDWQLWVEWNDQQSITNPTDPFVDDRLPNAGESFSIFTGGYGNNVTESNMVRDGSFVVIDRFGSTPGIMMDGGNNVAYDVGGTGVLGLIQWIPNGFVNIWVDTTGYYQDPQNVSALGISGNAAPYPETEGIRPAHYMLNPCVYIEPFTTWDVRYTMMNDIKNYMTNLGQFGGGPVTVRIVEKDGITSGGVPMKPLNPLAQVFIQYWLFNGSDALIAEELMKLGIAVNVDNAEWFRRQLVKQEGLETETWEKYLNISKAYLDMEKARQDYVG